MADCSDNFSRFNRLITLQPAEKKYLRKARRAITNKIRSNFKGKTKIPPFVFKVQGSFSMDTIVKPKNGEFDLDLGIHFRFDSNDSEAWPTPQTVSKWVFDAVNNHTATPPENKTTCVRVIYKPTSPINDYGYHIDLPIYGQYASAFNKQYTVIGLNNEEQWNQKTDPQGFTKWFNEKCTENNKDKNQLIRIVRYLKIWKDVRSKEVRMPSGMIMTILAGKNFFPKTRDDIVLYKMLDNTYFRLWWGFWIEKPVQPFNDLSKRLSSRQCEYFLEQLKAFRNDAYKAIHTESKDEAIKLWRKHLGDKFT